MIEALDYGLQFLILLVCGVYAGVRAVYTRERGWVLLCFFYACYALGDLYWLLCMALEGATPKLHFISELSWSAGYIFLCLLLQLVQTRHEPFHVRSAWLAPAFAAAACVFFLQYGDYLGNLVSAVIMSRLGFLVLRGLFGREKQAPDRRLYLAVAMIFLAEYGEWFATCFWTGVALAVPYSCFEAVMTVFIALLASAYRKAMAE